MKTKYLGAVKKYIKLKDELPEIIKLSGLKEQFIYQSIGMSPRTWQNRKTLKNWESEELLKILQLIER